MSQWRASGAYISTAILVISHRIPPAISFSYKQVPAQCSKFQLRTENCLNLKSRICNKTNNGVTFCSRTWYLIGIENKRWVNHTGIYLHCSSRPPGKNEKKAERALHIPTFSITKKHNKEKQQKRNPALRNSTSDHKELRMQRCPWSSHFALRWIGHNQLLQCLW